MFDRLLKQRTKRESVYFVRYTNEKKSEALRDERKYKNERRERERKRERYEGGSVR